MYIIHFMRRTMRVSLLLLLCVMPVLVNATSQGIDSPVADFSYSFSKSGKVVITWSNTSYKQGDPQKKPFAFDYANWNFGNGQTSTQYTPSPITYDAGTYTITLTVGYTGGESSSTTANLKVLYDTICAGDKYMFGGVERKTTGIYYSTTKQGTVSNITVLSLHVNKTYLITSSYSAPLCSSTPYKWRGRSLTQGGVYRDELISSEGCDSVYQLTLKMTSAFYDTVRKTICYGEKFKWRGKDYDKKGTYSEDYKTIAGCDSIYYLELKVSDPPQADVYATICHNGSYTFNGHTYTKGGDYQQTIVGEAGCATTYTVHITQYPQPDTLKFTETICSNQTYTFNKKRLSQSGVYYETTKNYNGCDSVTELTLVVLSTTDSYVVDSICSGEEFVIEGQRFTEPGEYVIQAKNTSGCDHYIHLTLKLIVPKITFGNDFHLCATDNNLSINYKYAGPDPYLYSVVFGDSARHQGFKDVLRQPLTETGVISIPFTPSADSFNYAVPGSYDAELWMYNDVCKDSVASAKFQFSVYFPSWVTQQRWNDVIAVLNAEHNGAGHYQFCRYKWYHNGELLPGEHKNYIYVPTLLDTAGYYHAELTRIVNGDSVTVATCPMRPKMVYDKNMVGETYMAVSPTVVDHRQPYVYFLSNMPASYYVYDFMGRLVNYGHYDVTGCNSMRVELPGTCSYYIFRMVSDSGETRSTKILVN